MRTLLIVDDHPVFRAAARRLLGCDGYEVVGEAADATSAIEAVGVLQPDVVLIDVQLPGRDGISVAEELDALACPPTVILTSSRDADDYGGRLRAAPCRAFVSKRALSQAALDALIADGG